MLFDMEIKEKISHIVRLNPTFTDLDTSKIVEISIKRRRPFRIYLDGKYEYAISGRSVLCPDKDSISFNLEGSKVDLNFYILSRDSNYPQVVIHRYTYDLDKNKSELTHEIKIDYLYNDIYTIDEELILILRRDEKRDISLKSKIKSEFKRLFKRLFKWIL